MSTLLLLCSAAMATLYEVEVAVGSGTGPLHPDTDTIGAARIIPDIAVGERDTVVSSTSPYITCEIKDEDVIVNIKADPADWGSLPTSADCVYGSDTLRVKPIVDTYESAWQTSSRLINASPLLIRLAPDHVGFRLYPLPPAGTYDAKVHQAKKSTGADWDGLFCESVQDSNSNWNLWIVVDDENVDRTHGSCLIANSTPGGLPYTLNIVLQDPL